jgi:hypothetical protein
MVSRDRLLTLIAYGLVIAIGLAFVVTQFVGVFTESVNWDELALVNRANLTLKLGALEGGGRPGLAVLGLLPFVSGCEDTFPTLMAIRIAWAIVTLGSLGAFYMLLSRALRSAPDRWMIAALGVALIALVPVFMRWSLQVRTDQPAIAAALWGSVALLYSRSRTWLAVVGGALWAISYLFTQKGIYLIGLGGIVALGDLFVDGEFDRRRDLKRMGFLVLGGVAALGAYKLIVPLFFAPAKTVAVGRGLESFAYYRKLFGFRVYESMIPTLYPQLVMLALLVPAIFIAYRRKSAQRRPLLIAIAVATAGVAVGWFHAAAFPYFWMTLGLFPACAIALGWRGIAEMLGRASKLVAIAVWLALLWSAIPYRAEVLHDTQDVQRRPFAFVARNFDASARGFNADGALFCRADPEPFRAYLRETVDKFFNGPGGEQFSQGFINEFRRRPVAFLVESFLLKPFPPSVRTFWDTHYVSYADNVAIPGRRLHGGAGAQIELDIIVGGNYRWFGPGAASIDGHAVEAGGLIALAVGPHVATLTQDTPAALIALAVKDAPGPQAPEFHAILPIAEIVGLRRRWR